MSTPGSARDWLLREGLPAVVVRRLLAYTPTLKGRGTRKEMFATFGVVIGVSALLPFLFPGKDDSVLAIAIIALNSVLAMLALGSAVVRRLHDAGRYGRSALVVFFPYVGWLFLLYYLLSQSSEANEFGPNPND
jgi:uncharacterized membrane protein YhaH (DUF805 family)